MRSRVCLKVHPIPDLVLNLLTRWPTVSSFQFLGKDPVVNTSVDIRRVEGTSQHEVKGMLRGSPYTLI